MVAEKIFEAALGISAPWHIAGLSFSPDKRVLKVCIDFHPGSRFAVPGEPGEHPAHDTVSKRYWRLNFFQHECELEVRVPRVRLPDGSVRQIAPPWAGKAQWLHAAVRGVRAGAVSGDDLPRCREDHRPVGASGDGDLRAPGG